MANQTVRQNKLRRLVFDPETTVGTFVTPSATSLVVLFPVLLSLMDSTVKHQEPLVLGLGRFLLIPRFTTIPVMPQKTMMFTGVNCLGLVASRLRTMVQIH
jgi:hypothetical protein